MTTPDTRQECEHGSLRRSCAICERDEEIASLRTQLAEARRERDHLNGELMKNWDAARMMVEEAQVERDALQSQFARLMAERNEARAELSSVRDLVAAEHARTCMEAEERWRLEKRLSEAEEHLARVCQIPAQAEEIASAYFATTTNPAGIGSKLVDSTDGAARPLAEKAGNPSSALPSVVSQSICNECGHDYPHGICQEVCLPGGRCLCECLEPRHAVPRPSGAECGECGHSEAHHNTPGAECVFILDILANDGRNDFHPYCPCNSFRAGTGEEREGGR